MKYILLAGLLLLLLVQSPAALLGLIGALGALALWMAAQPILWAFALGTLTSRRPTPPSWLRRRR